MTADVTKLIIAGVIAYALGNINPSIIISRVFYGIDIRKEGSGNPGTTNTLRVMGKKEALIVLLVDILKGAIWIEEKAQVSLLLLQVSTPSIISKQPSNGWFWRRWRSLPVICRASCDNCTD